MRMRWDLQGPLKTVLCSLYHEGMNIWVEQALQAFCLDKHYFKHS